MVSEWWVKDVKVVLKVVLYEDGKEVGEKEVVLEGREWLDASKVGRKVGEEVQEVSWLS